MPKKPGKDYGRPRAREKTRSNKPKLIDDTQEEEKLLKAQLAQAGLYTANTLGDGNCLFRALSDQLTGSDSSHAEIRHEVCEHLSSHADRYRLFVDSDSVPGGYEGHVGSMRRLGTYGTNIELSAFANLYQRSIKVMQPGLTYIITPEEIEGVVSPDAELTAAGMNEEEPLQENLTPRELRLRKRLAKTKEIKGKMKAKQAPKPKRAAGSLYIVYHSWEHYSSVRRLAGPHSGLPNIELPPAIDDDDDDGDEPTPTLSSVSLPSTPDEPTPPPPPAPLRERPTRGRPKKLPTSISSVASLTRAQSIALPASLPPSPASSPPPTGHSLNLGIPPTHNSSSPHRRARARHRSRSSSMSSTSGVDEADHHIHRKQRSRPATPATAELDAPSPATSLEEEELSEEEDEEEGDDSLRMSEATAVPAKAVGKGKGAPTARPRRGPTSREKKEITRQRRMELRRGKGASATAVERETRSKSGGKKVGKGASGEEVLMEVKELFI